MVLELSKEDLKNKFSFWPSNQPHWDAIATSSDGKILYLFEAKAHLKELTSKISATDKNSIEKIITSMKRTFEEISEPSANFKNWTDKYYQLGNRFTFLHNMNNMKFEKIQLTILILLNIIGDKTYISTSQEEWNKHYEEVFMEMIGKKQPPKNTKIIYFEAE